MSPPPSAIVHLIPWDPESPAHIQRLILQRKGCGWHSDKVTPQWRDAQRAGTRCLYWIAISPDDEDRHEKLKMHWKAYPQEKGPLQDTCTSFGGVPRAPFLSALQPIGHVSLDLSNDEAAGHDLDALLPSSENGRVYWIKSFYVSKALQGNGVGRAAMDVLEAIAVEPPLCATTIALDTQFHERGESAKHRKPSNHEWYARRGYEVIKVARANYPPEDDEVKDTSVVGGDEDKRMVFMKKTVS